MVPDCKSKLCIFCAVFPGVHCTDTEGSESHHFLWRSTVSLFSGWKYMFIDVLDEVTPTLLMKGMGEVLRQAERVGSYRDSTASSFRGDEESY